MFPQHFFHEQETILTHFSNFIQTKGSRFLWISLTFKGISELFSPDLLIYCSASVRVQVSKSRSVLRPLLELFVIFQAVSQVCLLVSLLLQKRLCHQPFTKLFLGKNFWYDLRTKLFVCFSAHVGRHFVKSNKVRRHFCPVIRVLPRFSGILRRFLGILPGFSTNQYFWGWDCTPCNPLLHQCSLGQDVLFNHS